MLKLNPQIAVWEYTLACNSKCIHCGSNAICARPNELNTKESLNLVEQLADIGFKQIILSGGEPTLRQDWSEIAQKINETGMEFGIISNALAWRQDTIDTLASLEPFSVGFSVDGEKELHDYLRGVKGSHKKVFHWIKELKRRDVTICAVTAVNKRNLEELPKIRNRLIVYGVDAWQLQVASPMGRMSENQDIILDNEGYYKFGEFIAESRLRLTHMNIQAGDCVGYYGKLENQIRDSEWQGCMAGIMGLGIESDGTIKGCLSMQATNTNEGNIREQSLKEIWENQEKFKYNRQFKNSDLSGECAGCEKGNQCRGGCTSQSLAFFGEHHNSPYCLLRQEKNGGNKNEQRDEKKKLIVYNP